MTKNEIEKFRASERARAKAAGTTIEEELDQLEEFIHCKEYVDILRELLGVEIRQG